VKKLPYKVMTGYTLYSSEIRKDIATKHPEASFGEISRLVGAEVST
jgi:protein polybromo-1